MNKKIHALAVVLSLGTSLFAQNPFQTVIGEEVQSYQEQVLVSVATSDGGVLAAVENDDNRYLMKTNADGQPIWSYIYTTDETDLTPNLPGLLATSDGGAYVIVDAKTESQGPSDYEFVFVVTRINADGDILWSKRYRCPEIDSYFFKSSAALLANDDFQLSWYQWAGGGPDHTLRISASGDLLWARRQTQGSLSSASFWYDTHVASDDGVVLTRVAHGNGLHPVSMSRWAPDGTLMWNKTVRMTNANWEYYMGMSLLTASGDLFIHARQMAVVVQPNDFPLLIKIDPTGDLVWYKLYGSGSTETYLDEHCAIQLTNTDIRFGALQRSTFTLDGAHLSSESTIPPTWTAGSFTYSFNLVPVLESEDHVLLPGTFRRIDNVFSTNWTTPFLGRIDLAAPLNCGWTEAVIPQQTDTVVPAEFIDYQDDIPWATLPVSVGDTVVFAVPFTPPTSIPYCAPVGIAETNVTKAASLTALPNIATAGTPITINTSVGGALCLMDHSGSLLQTTNISAAASHTLATGGLSPGMYLLLLQRDDGQPALTARLVIE